jgi:ribosomal subunit interface protein
LFQNSKNNAPFGGPIRNFPCSAVLSGSGVFTLTISKENLMKLPLDISARDVRVNEQIEELIRDKASKLDRIYDQLIGCRVKIDKPHRSQRNGMTYNVSIDLTVPGGEVIVKRESDQDLRVAIVNSFETAQRRLKEYAERQRGDVKTHFEKPVVTEEPEDEGDQAVSGAPA